MTEPVIFILGDRGFLGQNILSTIRSTNLNVIGISRNEISLYFDGEKIVCPSGLERIKNLGTDILKNRILINCVRENASLSRPEFFELLEFLASGASMVINFSTYIQYYELNQNSQLSTYRHNQHQQSLFLESVTQDAQFIDIALFTLYGPGDSPNSFLSSLVQRTKSSEPLKLSGLQQLVSYTWVKDVARMVSEVAFQLQSIEGRFSFWPVPPMRLSEVVRMIVSQTKSKREILAGVIPYKGHELFIYDEGIFPPQIIQSFEWTPMHDGLSELLPPV